MKMITYTEIDTLSDEGVKPMAEIANHIPKGVIKRISFKNENELVFGAKKVYLEDVRRIATDYAVRQILHNGFSGEISDLTRFYVLYRWNYSEAKVQFDEARKLAQSCGIDLALEWNRPVFISKEKEFIRLLGPQDRKLEELEGSSKLIDVLHRVLLLWEKSKRIGTINLLQESGFGRSEAFYRVAQAVSESLAIESKEKKLLDGFLAGRERLREEVKKEQVQRRLFE